MFAEGNPSFQSSTTPPHQLTQVTILSIFELVSHHVIYYDAQQEKHKLQKETKTKPPESSSNLNDARSCWTFESRFPPTNTHHIIGYKQAPIF
jgi:hypothetical protein